MNVCLLPQRIFISRTDVQGNKLNTNLNILAVSRITTTPQKNMVRLVSAPSPRTNMLFTGRLIKGAKFYLVYNLTSACLIELLKFGDVNKHFYTLARSDSLFMTHKISNAYNKDDHVMFVHAMYGNPLEQARIIAAIRDDSNAFGVYSRLMALACNRQWFPQAVGHGFTRTNDLNTFYPLCRTSNTNHFIFTRADRDRGVKVQLTMDVYFENENKDRILFMKDLHRNNIESLLGKAHLLPFCIKMKNRGGYGAFLDENSQKEFTEHLIHDVENIDIGCYRGDVCKMNKYAFLKYLDSNAEHVGIKVFHFAHLKRKPDGSYRETPGDFMRRHWVEECKEVAVLRDVVCDSKRQFEEMTTIRCWHSEFAFSVRYTDGNVFSLCDLSPQTSKDDRGSGAYLTDRVFIILQERCQSNIQTMDDIDFGLFFADVNRFLLKIHAKNVVHKDIKPENIVFCPQSGHFKVIDYGFLTAITKKNQFDDRLPQALSGTRGYQSVIMLSDLNMDKHYSHNMKAIILYHIGSFLNKHGKLEQRICDSYEALQKRPFVQLDDKMYQQFLAFWNGTRRLRYNITNANTAKMFVMNDNFAFAITIFKLFRKFKTKMHIINPYLQMLLDFPDV
jgi:serine/threonine protein kinase